MRFNIPDNILKAMNIMKKNGYESYLVGGCVRDFLMGKEPHDFDITTNAKPEQTIKCFSDFKVIETGIKHGTVTVIIDKEPIEITTFRIDGKYTDNRHPENVEFTVDLKEDLSRRDFTVNALAYNHDTGIVDLFSGREDLENKKIRCVGNPDTRFSEDGLRILRALRFSAVLGFDICKETANSVKRNKNLLLNISKERIYSEMSKLICGINAYAILTEFREVVEVFLPNLKKCSSFENSVMALSDLPPQKELRYAALFSECDSPKLELLSLKSDKKTAVYTEILVKYLKKEIIFDEIFIKKILINLEFDELYDVLKLKEAFDEDVSDIKWLVNKISESGECVKIKDLAVSGRDIMENNIASGKAVGEILERLLLAVIEKKVKNSKEELLSYILS